MMGVNCDVLGNLHYELWDRITLIVRIFLKAGSKYKHAYHRLMDLNMIWAYNSDLAKCILPLRGLGLAKFQYFFIRLHTLPYKQCSYF